MSEEPFGVHAVHPNRNVLVIVQRQGGTQPPYEIAGHTRCMYCDHWCWLDVEVMKVILDAKATPVCVECSAGAINGVDGVRFGHARDL